MDSLQYYKSMGLWTMLRLDVLNLVINGIPSILEIILNSGIVVVICFKPYYNWNTFNTRTGDCTVDLIGGKF